MSRAVLLPQSWTPSTDTLVNKIFREVMIEAERLGYDLSGLTPRPFVFPKSAGKTSAGTVYGQTRYSDRINRVHIGLNAGLVATHDLQKILPVIIHEMAHSVKTARHDGHGDIWRKVGDSIGKSYGVTVECRVKDDERVEDIAPVKRPDKYTIGCPKCKNVWGYSRMCASVEHPALWRCSKCKVPLVRIK